MTDSKPYGGRGRTDINLWGMEYAKPKLRKFWQAEGRQRSSDMRFQEPFYFTCIYEMLEHLEAIQETAKKQRYFQPRIRELYAVRVRRL